MHRPLIAATLACLAFVAVPALAQEEALMEHIETVQGDSAGFGEAFGALQDGFLFDTAAQSMADLAAYPLEIAANGEVYDILEPADLIDNFDDLVTPETLSALESQDFADLIVTGEGVGFANGALWMANTCADDACEATSWQIIRINN